MMKTTEWREYSKGEWLYRIRAKYGIDYDFARRNNQAPYFSITGETEATLRRTRWLEDSGGCIHEAIAEHFPELAPLVKWHLGAVGEGPMHYLANAVYWWEHADAIRSDLAPYEWEKYGSPRAAGLAHFRSTALVGALPGDVEPREGTPPVKVREWLQDRLPALLDAFMAAMREAGVLE